MQFNQRKKKQKKKCYERGAAAKRETFKGISHTNYRGVLINNHEDNSFSDKIKDPNVS